jgi:coiled-coil domain-containing protein 55
MGGGSGGSGGGGGGGGGSGGGYGLRIPEKSGPKATNLFGEEDFEKKPNKSLVTPKLEERRIDELQKEALEEDPTVFDYDDVYESVSSVARFKSKLNIQRKEDTAPKYMSKIMKTVEERKRELEISKVRKHQSENSKNAPIGGGDEGGGEVFVTAAYRKKLEEMKARGLDPDTPKEEEKGVQDIDKFYRNVIYKQRRERSPDRR